MDGKTLLFELLMAGFFAVACIRAHGPVESGHKLTFGEFFRLSDRQERLKHTHRLLGLEIMVAAQLVIFLTLPVRAVAKGGARGR
jgi:hypothetical protein